jgi:diguanylate cyclase (GGDEF)-like protein/PAS domain S-box-containing protein
VGAGLAGSRGGQKTPTSAAAFAPETLLALLQHARDAIGILEPDGTIRHGPFGFLGFTPEELAGRFALELVHPDDVGDATSLMLDAMSTAGPTPPFRARMLHADGSWRWYEMTAVNMVDDPHVRGLVFNGRDIHALKEAEDEAERSERRWRALAGASATERVTVLDAEGTIIFSTSNGLNLDHDPWDPSTMADRMFELLHPDDIGDVAGRIAAIAATPGPSEAFLVRLQAGDGRWLWVEAMPNNQLHNPDVGGIVITTRDVHEREEAMRRLHDETRVLESLHAIGRRLAAELDLDTLLQEVTDAGTDVTDAAFGAFFHNAQGQEGNSYLLYAVTDAPRDVVADFPLRAPDLFGHIFSGAAPVRIDDLRTHHRFDAPAVNPLGVRSFLGVPVVSRTGEVHGGIFFGHPEPGVFTERGERLAVGIAAHAAIAIDNARLYQSAQHEIEARGQAEAELAHQATHDLLTGLPNRRLLRDRLAQALAHCERSGHAVAVLLLDLDRFKVVNDSLSHAVGDRVLIGVAERLREALRPSDTVARLGGDEFALVCENLNGQLDAVGVADRVASALAEPLMVGTTEITVTASVGITMAAAPDTDPDTLLRDADAVMYRAKARGGNRWEIFDAGLRDQVVDRLRVETALRRGLSAHEIALYVQPIVDLQTGATVGGEGLARWEHAGRGIVMPDDFISIAEDSGLVIPLGEQMLQQGCTLLGRWAKDPATADHTLSVNVSARQLVHGDLVGAVRRSLALAGADPSRLSLEITETVLMEDVAAAGEVLRRLRSLGVHLWVDDFGTGYSSLIHLRRLPLDGLKIDRSFVAGLDTEEEDRVIVGSIIKLAHSLGLVALAEGVETEQQADHLRRLACDLAQGYLWSPAMPTM